VFVGPESPSLSATPELSSTVFTGCVEVLVFVTRSDVDKAVAVVEFPRVAVLLLDLATEGFQITESQTMLIAKTVVSLLFDSQELCCALQNVLFTFEA
jgi:hypothetical protein